MTIVLLTFFATLTLVVGSYWVAVARPELQTAARVRQRLEVKTERPIGAASIVKTARPETVREGLIGRLVKWHQRYAVASAARLIERAGMRIEPARLIAGTAIALVVNVVVLSVMQAGALTTLIAGMMTPLVPYAYLKRAARRRLAAFEALFPDAIGLVARAMRAGHALTTALTMVADEMPDPVKPEFRALHEQHQYGLPLTQVLRAFAARIPLIDVRFFVTAVLMHRETGGNLAEVLDNLAKVTHERFRIRRQLRILTAQGRMSGWILVALPLCLGTAIYVFNPERVAAFINDPIGIRMVETAVVLELIGAVLIRKIVSVEY